VKDYYISLACILPNEFLLGFAIYVWLYSEVSSAHFSVIRENIVNINLVNKAHI